MAEKDVAHKNRKKPPIDDTWKKKGPSKKRKTITVWEFREPYWFLARTEGITPKWFKFDNKYYDHEGALEAVKAAIRTREGERRRFPARVNRPIPFYWIGDEPPNSD